MKLLGKVSLYEPPAHQISINMLAGFSCSIRGTPYCKSPSPFVLALCDRDFNLPIPKNYCTTLEEIMSELAL